MWHQHHLRSRHEKPNSRWHDMRSTRRENSRWRYLACKLRRTQGGNSTGSASQIGERHMGKKGRQKWWPRKDILISRLTFRYKYILNYLLTYIHTYMHNVHTQIHTYMQYIHSRDTYIPNTQLSCIVDIGSSVSHTAFRREMTPDLMAWALWRRSNCALAFSWYVCSILPFRYLTCFELHTGT